MLNNENSAIGGYFSLELPLRKSEYHSEAIAVNSGKNAFEYILASYGFKIKKVYLPYYTSRIMVKPLEDHHIEYEFYHINESLEIISNVKVAQGELWVYTNYFGLKGEYIELIAKKYGSHLVVDNAQAFFDMPLDGVNTFYSPRKFFGVLDGGYAYSQGTEPVELSESISYDRMGYLLKRIDTSAEEAFADYKLSCHLGSLPVSKMSSLTKRILSSVDYDAVAEVRRRNYSILADSLSANNKLDLELGDAVPLVYPYMSDDFGLRSRLIESKIYVAQYWPNVLEWCKSNELESYLTNQIIPLPIDQRYGEEEMNYIIKIIQNGRK
jgi:hypothetical protein